MAVISTRLGRVLPGSKVTPTRVTVDEEFNFDPTGGVTLVDETGGGSASGAAALQRAALERQKFAQETAAAQSALERQRAGAAAQTAYLRGQLGAGIPTEITGEIAAQEAAGQKYIQDQAKALLDLLSGRRTQAVEQIGQAYGGLQTFLEQNVPQAFAQAQRAQPQTVQSALGQYMAGQGVSPAVAQEAAQLANVQAAGGAANFNQLLDVLAAREAAAQQSRLAEAQMGRAAGVTGIESLYGAGTAQLEQQRLAALADLASRISGARLTAQQQQIARNQAIQDALSSLLGTGLVTPEQVTGAPTTPVVTTPPAAPTPVEQLAAKLPGIKNASLANRVESFVASNPNATPAQIKKQFPSLGKNITR